MGAVVCPKRGSWRIHISNELSFICTITFLYYGPYIILCLLWSTVLGDKVLIGCHYTWGSLHVLYLWVVKPLWPMTIKEIEPVPKSLMMDKSLRAVREPKIDTFWISCTNIFYSQNVPSRWQVLVCSFHLLHTFPPQPSTWFCFHAAKELPAYCVAPPWDGNQPFLPS